MLRGMRQISTFTFLLRAYRKNNVISNLIQEMERHAVLVGTRRQLQQLRVSQFLQSGQMEKTADSAQT